MLGDFFLIVRPCFCTGVGQLRHGQRDAVLHHHQGGVQIGAQVEGDRQVVGAVVAALRRHVEHALDAVDLLLDRRGHRVGHHLARWPRDRCTTPGPSAERWAGYWAIGSETTATLPASVMTIDSTAAKIGRSMKKREIMAATPSGLGRQEGVLGFSPAGLAAAGLATVGFPAAAQPCRPRQGGHVDFVRLDLASPGRTRCRPLTTNRSPGLSPLLDRLQAVEEHAQLHAGDRRPCCPLSRT